MESILHAAERPSCLDTSDEITTEQLLSLASLPPCHSSHNTVDSSPLAHLSEPLPSRDPSIFRNIRARSRERYHLLWVFTSRHCERHLGRGRHAELPYWLEQETIQVRHACGRKLQPSYRGCVSPQS